MALPAGIRNTQPQHIHSFAVSLIDANERKLDQPQYRNFFKNTKIHKSLVDFKKEFRDIAEEEVKKFRPEIWEEISGTECSIAAADLLLDKIWEMLRAEYVMSR